ncbi:hypothetical protein OOK31_25595 [Streptomyces sp. NBC_00249]|uniref:hypothetical protein n=1 Tax=Streptomyces sp. NBC_00249 TaxID=2975690 RepID=UPI002256F647|nr:hypothetical protein [Streptomyces sp. NBC_00249]MCX5197232.1 hypothetical protein [Streptomyces sp. NBC_00249]
MPIAAGQIITAAYLDRLENPPVAILQQTVVQSIANGVWGVITFDTEIKDTYGGHSTVTNTSRYTVQLAGTYRVTGRAAFANNATGSRGARIHKNGVFIQGAANLAGAGTLAGISEASHLLDLAVGDYVEVAGGQNSGGSLSTSFSGEAASMMYIEWIHS